MVSATSTTVTSIEFTSTTVLVRTRKSVWGDGSSIWRLQGTGNGDNAKKEPTFYKEVFFIQRKGVGV